MQDYPPIISGYPGESIAINGWKVDAASEFVLQRCKQGDLISVAVVERSYIGPPRDWVVMHGLIPEIDAGAHRLAYARRKVEHGARVGVVGNPVVKFGDPGGAARSREGGSRTCETLQEREWGQTYQPARFSAERGAKQSAQHGVGNDDQSCGVRNRQSRHNIDNPRVRQLNFDIRRPISAI